MIRDHYNDPSFFAADLLRLEGLLTQKLKEITQEKLETLGAWRLGDPIHDPQVIIDLLTLNLSAAVTVYLDDSQRISGYLESLQWRRNNMIYLYIEARTGCSVIVGERIERIPFLWYGQQHHKRMDLTIERVKLPSGWFSNHDGTF